MKIWQINGNVDGKPVVDLWGGWADMRHSVPWAEDSKGLPFSATKGLTTICARHHADAGLLDADAPFAKYWREFAANDGQSEFATSEGRTPAQDHL